MKRSNLLLLTLIWLTQWAKYYCELLQSQLPQTTEHLFTWTKTAEKSHSSLHCAWLKMTKLEVTFVWLLIGRDVLSRLLVMALQCGYPSPSGDIHIWEWTLFVSYFHTQGNNEKRRGEIKRWIKEENEKF